MRSILAMLTNLLLISTVGGSVAGLSAADNESGIHNGTNIHNSLSLQQALSWVFENNPQVIISELEIEAAAARMHQAELKPNPELNLEVENFPALTGTGASSYLESTLQVSHRLETGGKRSRRIKAATSYKSMTEREAEVRKAELTASTAAAFFNVLGVQERLDNQRELTKLSQQSRSVVLERIAAGKVSPVEQVLAEIELASAQLEEERLVKNLAAAKDRLAALWGGSFQDFAKASGKFEIPVEPVSWGATCPDLGLAEATVDFRRKTLASEQASRSPDLTFSGGIRHMNTENINALVFGVSLPLPIFDKRQGAVSEAKIQLEKANSERVALERRIGAALAQSYHERDVALLEVNILSEKTLPAAMEAVSAVEEGYRLGKFTFMNLLDAQRTHAQLRQRYIDAVDSGLQATVKIGRFIHCGADIRMPAHERDKEEIYDEK